MSLEGKFGPPDIWGAAIDEPYTSQFDPRRVEKDISITFRGLSRMCTELGEEGFEEIAPQMYALYKEMQKIDNYRKMADILEDN